MISKAEWRAVRSIIIVRAVQVGALAGLLLYLLSRFVPRPWLILIMVAGGILVTVGLSVYFSAVFDPRTDWGFPLVVDAAGGSETEIALTFDDGPFPETTPVILAALKQYGAKATFFLVAENVRRWPELAKRIAEDGHAIGLHGLRHEAMVLKSGSRIAAELEEGKAILTKAVGPLPGLLFRPPHGFKTATLCGTAVRRGWKIVAWSVDARDYDPISAEAVVRNVVDAWRAGAIVLLHERPGREETLRALPEILRIGREQGWRFMAVGQNTVEVRVHNGHVGDSPD